MDETGRWSYTFECDDEYVIDDQFRAQHYQLQITDLKRQRAELQARVNNLTHKVSVLENANAVLRAQVSLFHQDFNEERKDRENCMQIVEQQKYIMAQHARIRRTMLDYVSLLKNFLQSQAVAPRFTYGSSAGIDGGEYCTDGEVDSKESPRETTCKTCGERFTDGKQLLDHAGMCLFGQATAPIYVTPECENK